ANWIATVVRRPRRHLRAVVPAVPGAVDVAAEPERPPAAAAGGRGRLRATRRPGAAPPDGAGGATVGAAAADRGPGTLARFATLRRSVWVSHASAKRRETR